jgi:hypothetical protein
MGAAAMLAGLIGLLVPRSRLGEARAGKCKAGRCGGDEEIPFHKWTPLEAISLAPRSSSAETRPRLDPAQAAGEAGLSA